MRGPTETPEDKLARIGYELEEIRQEQLEMAERLTDLRAQFHEWEARKEGLDKDMDRVEQELAEWKKQHGTT